MIFFLVTLIVTILITFSYANPCITKEKYLNKYVMIAESSRVQTISLHGRDLFLTRGNGHVFLVKNGFSGECSISLESATQKNYNIIVSGPDAVQLNYNTNSELSQQLSSFIMDEFKIGFVQLKVQIGVNDYYLNGCDSKLVWHECSSDSVNFVFQQVTAPDTISLNSNCDTDEVKFSDTCEWRQSFFNRIVRFESIEGKNKFIANNDLEGVNGNTNKHETEFILRPGFSGKCSIALESVSSPNHYLIKLPKSESLKFMKLNSISDLNQATFLIGKSHDGAYVFLESFQYRQHYIRVCGDGLYLNNPNYISTKCSSDAKSFLKQTYFKIGRTSTAPVKFYADNYCKVSRCSTYCED